MISPEIKNKLISYPGTTYEQKCAIYMMICYYNQFFKIFPDRISKIPKFEGDPRKLLAFKHCYKAISKFKLDPVKYNNFIKAQFQILDLNKDPSLIGPQCLSSDNALMRYNIWQKKVISTKKNELLKPIINTEHILSLCENSHKFLKKKEYKNEDIKQLISRNLIDSYYIFLSPKYKKIAETTGWDFFGIDKELLSEYTSKELEEKFLEKFKNE